MTPDDRDETLERRLREALEAEDPVPAHVLEAARAAIGWRTIDAELAELLTEEGKELAGVRGAGEAQRQLTFAAGAVELELLVDATAGPRIDGQLVPPGPATVLLQATDGTDEEVRTDELGRFAFVAIAARRVRLAVRPDAGAALVTPWLAL
jgi:hypothetical protein